MEHMPLWSVVDEPGLIKRMEDAAGFFTNFENF
jgi:hypothetical protein